MTQSTSLPPELVKAVTKLGHQYVAAPWPAPQSWVICELVFPEVFPPFGMTIGVAIAARRNDKWEVKSMTCGTGIQYTPLSRSLEASLNACQP